MSSISTIGTVNVPKAIQAQAPAAPPRQVDSDGDHDGSPAPSASGTGRRLNVTA